MLREHSITIGSKNTWEDWHLQPSSRPVVAPPNQKTNFIDIPGSNGHLDLSEVPMGYPVYENRTGSWEFIVVNGYRDWDLVYSDIMNYLHGRTMQVILDDDPGYYYEGRLTVSNWTSNTDGTWSTIEISYNLGPFKYSVINSLDDWLWDPFDFENDVIPEGYFSKIEIEPEDEWVEFDYSRFIGRAPVVPIVSVENPEGKEGQGILVSFYNSRLGDFWTTAVFPEGSSKLSDMLFMKMVPEDIVKVRLRGHATVSLYFRRGIL